METVSWKLTENIHTELKQHKTKGGYLRVHLRCKDRKRKIVPVHRLVAMSLIENPFNLETVDHIDNNKNNNHPSNLQWITRSDNVKKAQSMGRWGTHPKKYEIKFKCGFKIIIENISKFSRENNYAATKLVAISKGKLKSHKNIIGVLELP